MSKNNIMTEKKKDKIVIGSLEIDKIKVGKVFNIISTILFFAWMLLVIIMMPVFDRTTFLVLAATLLILFVISCIISNICLKDYKPEKTPDKKRM